MATASVTLALNQSTFLAGIARAQSAVSGLGSSVAGIGARGFAIAGAAVAAFGTATAVGIKKAFDLGGSLADMSAITGRSVRSILLLRRALEDAGISMEKIDRFILTGQDRGQVIARALQNISAGDWAEAAKSIGTQADILDKNTATFDRVSDLLGRSGQKLQGFFVGTAGAISKSLLPILERLDKMDLAKHGEKFGQGLLVGAQALVGFFSKPELILAPFEAAFTASVAGIGNLLNAVFKQALATLDAGFQAAFENMMPGEGKQSWMDRAVIGLDRLLYEAVGENMSGQMNSTGIALQKEIDRLSAKEKPKPFLDRMAELTSGQKFEVEDVFGAKDAMLNAQKGIKEASALGRTLLPPEMAAKAQQKDKSFSEAGLAAFGAAGGTKSGLTEEQFMNRWSGLMGPSGAGNAESIAKKEDQSKALLEKIAEGQDESNDLFRQAWLSK